MFLFLCSIIAATAAGLTAFLLWVSGDFNKFRESFTITNAEEPKKQLPMVTRDGQIIDSKEELEAQLEVLQYNLEKKKSELDSSRSRIFETANSLKKLKNTSAEVRKYYLRLSSEVKKYETDCAQLQQEIDEYKKKKYDLDTNASSDNFEDVLSHLDIDSLSTASVHKNSQHQCLL